MHNKTKLFFIFFLFLSFISSVFAADDEPLPGDQAFKFDAVVKDNHVLATWTMADDYYMYHDKFRFESATPGVTLGTPIFPKGKMHNGILPDGSEGKVEVFMHSVTIDVPITSANGSELKLIAHGQGCAEKLGICYPPQKHERVLTLASADAKPTSAVSALGAQLGLGNNATDEPLPPEQAFGFSAVAEGGKIVATWTIAPDYYMYRDKFSFEPKTPGLTFGKPEVPPGKMKHGIKPDGSEGEVETYMDHVTITVPYTLDNKVDGIEFVANGQGCAEKLGICYPPQHRTALVSVTQSPSTTAPPVASKPVTAPGKTEQPAGPETKSSFWDTVGRLVFAFFSGLGLTFTPCVLPMLPIISSIIAGQGDKVTKARGGFLAAIYVLGTAVVWTIAGVVAGASGEQLQAYTSSPYFLLPVALVLLVLSLAMFGIYNLQMPASLQSKAQEKSYGLKGGTVIGVFLMGVLASVIAGACVSPILILNLGVAMQTHDAVLGGGLMFLMALGMGVPIILIGIGAGWLLPKAGTWMDTVKYVFGVILIGLAIYIISSIPWIPVLFLWAPFLIITGVYMGATRTTPEGASGWQTLWKGIGLFLLIWGVLALVGAMQGNRDILQPIQLGSAGGGGTAVNVTNAEAMFDRVHSLEDMEAKFSQAKAAGKPVFLDYYATWCTDCNLMKKSVFSDAQVQQYMRDNFVVVQADVSDQFDKRTQPMKDKFGVFGPPALLFFDRQGNLVKKSYGLLTKDEFMALATAAAQKN
ncbi:MAG: protein-disulfide reductase DsbD [Gammaproteobacteria bacterium]|nr:protein-disulfide reductase DsbD [Gammaproteobacteria bacterium]